ncbi:MAG: type II toxin-antitoxin system HicB family antitoxin [Alkalinema sp. RU_4_3]|nr:type II toxin-antitoxin system HicB family antitoxin [Alkalinema sp. RU_4_3]
MRSLADYTIVVRPDDNGTFVAYVPAIKSCHALGSTAEEARSELQNVFDMIAEEYAESGQIMPQDVELMVSHAR